MKCTIFFRTVLLLFLFAGSLAGAQDQADIDAIHKLKTIKERRLMNALQFKFTHFYFIN